MNQTKLVLASFARYALGGENQCFKQVYLVSGMRNTQASHLTPPHATLGVQLVAVVPALRCPRVAERSSYACVTAPSHAATIITAHAPTQPPLHPPIRSE